MSWIDTERGVRPYLAHLDFDEYRLAKKCKGYAALREEWSGAAVESDDEIKVEQDALRHEARCKTCIAEMVTMRLEGAVWESPR
jgi:sulfur carrier protein ThiS